MAITKILNIGKSDKGVLSGHLKHALNYIVNPEKTQSGMLVGSVNCLPDAEDAYLQMVETKQMLGKELGRQGYHVIISFEKGECEPETAFQIAEEWVKRFLNEEYEVVYSVHDDKEHCHIHIIYNSVNMVTGMKFAYKKGDWKNTMQPLTNRLCEKHKLSIMPAEYSEDKKNLPRHKWEQAQKGKDFIANDVGYVLGVATDYEHFIYLLQQLGYEVKQGVHIAVKTDGMKRFRRLDTIDSAYSVDNIRERFKEGGFDYRLPQVASTKSLLHSPRNGYQKKFHDKYIRLQTIEYRRFYENRSRYWKDLLALEKLQEEYLYLIRRDINSPGTMIGDMNEIDRKIAKLSEHQQKLYRQRSKEKRSCKCEADGEHFNDSGEKYHKALSEIKEEKRKLRDEKKIIKRILEENLYKAFWVKPVEIDNPYEVKVPEMPWYMRENPVIAETKKQEFTVLSVKEKGAEAIFTEREEESDVILMDENVGQKYEKHIEKDRKHFAEIHEEDLTEMKTAEADTEELTPLSEISEVDWERMAAAYECSVEEMKELMSLLEEDTNKSDEFQEAVMTKGHYEKMTDKEKTEWLGTDKNGTEITFSDFMRKMEELGIYFDDLLDAMKEYNKIDDAVEQEESHDKWYEKPVRRR